MFSQAHQSLQALPQMQLFLPPAYVELPFLAAVFAALYGRVPAEVWSRYHWLVVSPDVKAEELPAITRSHILVCIGNENGLLPAYAHQAGHVFTPYLRQQPDQDNVSVIPLGCNGHAPALAVLPMDQRSLHVSFVGQILPLRRPFINAGMNFLETAKPHAPLQAFMTFTPRFQSGLPPQVYADILHKTCLAPVPWGQAPITFRLFEALRAGCVVVTGPLPPYPYLNHLPAVRVDHDWRNFSEKVFAILQKPEQLQDLQTRSLAYYDQYCSPEAVAEQMACVICPAS